MKFLSSFIDFIYPKFCIGCGCFLQESEKDICTYCRLHLPYTFYENQELNPIRLAFTGRIPISQASSIFFFCNNSCVQKLLHKLKYDGRYDIGLMLGFLMGVKLHKSSLYKDLDYIIPLPLHPDKQKKRGYNQAEAISIGIIQGWKSKQDSPKLLNKLLLKTKENETQTHKSREERWDNVQNVFSVDQTDKKIIDLIKGKHLLLVDDVITTGATIESAAAALLSITNIRLSITSAAAPVY